MDHQGVETFSGRAIVDDGPVAAVARIAVEVEDRVEESRLPRPDLSWSALDKEGHWHAYAGDGSLPTLREERKHKGCGLKGDHTDDCGVYTVIRYRCRICDRKVRPSELSGTHTFTVPGPRWWSAVLQYRFADSRDLPMVKVGAQVTVRLLITGHSQMQFGIAHVDTLQTDVVCPSGPGAMLLHLRGLGELAERDFTALDALAFGPLLPGRPEMMP